MAHRPRLTHLLELWRRLRRIDGRCRRDLRNTPRVGVERRRMSGPECGARTRHVCADPRHCTHSRRRPDLSSLLRSRVSSCLLGSGSSHHLRFKRLPAPPLAEPGEQVREGDPLECERSARQHCRRDNNDKKGLKGEVEERRRRRRGWRPWRLQLGVRTARPVDRRRYSVWREREWRWHRRRRGRR